MRYEIIIAALSRLLLIIGFAMLVPLGAAFYFGEPTFAFSISIVLTLGVGVLLMKVFPLKDLGFIKPKEGYAIVTFGWIVVTLFGALPFILSGAMNFTDAIFETMSGFTTAGASILTDVEAMPKGLLLWRSQTQWLGGMGIVVLYIALLSQMGVSAVQIFRAEAPGPVAEKITPKIKDTSKILWATYLILSAILLILLWIAGMSFFDAINHTFTAIATGGYSTKNASAGYFGPLIQTILIIFMFLGGTNFALYYQFYKRKSLKVFWNNEEFRLYLSITLGSILLIAASLFFMTQTTAFKSLLDSSFQVVSLITTTGYATVDYDQWPFFPKAILVLLLFIGGSLGSTGGGIKIGRYLILFKLFALELKRFTHPRSILTLRINDKEVSDSVIFNTLLFFFVYMSIFGLGVVVMSGLGLDLVSASTAVIACLGVIGPGLGVVGPVQNYSEILPLGKYFLAFLMLVGRLELFTVLVLLLPYTWKKRQ